MNNLNIVVFDFETAGTIVRKNGGLDASQLIPIQIACVVLDARKLNIIPGSEFQSMMRPPEDCVLNPQALSVNKKTEKEIREAPADWQTVWTAFCNHVKRFNPNNNSAFTAPIPAGKNIRNFDLPIANWLCEKYGFVDKNNNPNIFNSRISLDIEDNLFSWFWHNSELSDYKMDTVREYFGLSSENAHDAAEDVRQTAIVLKQFLLLHKSLFKKVGFKNSLKEEHE